MSVGKVQKDQPLWRDLGLVQSKGFSGQEMNGDEIRGMDIMRSGIPLDLNELDKGMLKIEKVEDNPANMEIIQRIRNRIEL